MTTEISVMYGSEKVNLEYNSDIMQKSLIWIVFKFPLNMVKVPEMNV